MPRVSAIVPVFNAERTIGEAIDSILAQSFRDFEIVAVDDGSGDASLRSLEPWRDRIKLLRQPNRGPSAARNHGVRESSGELLAFLDADDRWRLAMLEKMVAALDAHRAAALAYCDVAVIDSEGRALMTALAGEQGAPTVAEMLDKLWPIMPSAVVMRRDALEAAGGWPEVLTSFEDVYLWLRMREHGEFVHLNETLLEWRFAHFPCRSKRPEARNRRAASSWRWCGNAGAAPAKSWFRRASERLAASWATSGCSR